MIREHTTYYTLTSKRVRPQRWHMPLFNVICTSGSAVLFATSTSRWLCSAAIITTTTRIYPSINTIACPSVSTTRHLKNRCERTQVRVKLSAARHDMTSQQAFYYLYTAYQSF